ncbi:MAG: heparinase II/III family protein, partial [Rhodospirillales bacterium]|nr:heparinase II/III family protein [Rhodospirillales bacterium]
MTGIWLNRISRGLSRPPGELARRLAMEGRAFLERFQGPPAGPLDEAGLWERLGARPSPWFTRPVDTSLYETHCPGDGERILAAADAAIEGRIDLLGSGPVQLSRPLPWPEDFKTGLAWPHKFHRDIDVNDFSRPSDVKLPWEFSRLQWALPAGQAYLLKGEARYAEFVRALLEEWIKANPYGRGVNWTSAMEASMRIFVWVWFFHVFHQAPAWQDESFRNDFLISLYRHGVYVSRYLEDFGLNGNHCVADGAGLVVAGLFFGEGGKPASWVAQGWRVLEREMFRQTHPDGVDFEASTFYHRLVAELFLLPMAYRRVLGMEVPGAMDERLALMGEFADSYMAGQAAAPLWGDGDDGRVLPFGGQAVGDHNYLGPLIRNYLGDGAPVSPELFWLSGPPAASGIEGKPTAPS